LGFTLYTDDTLCFIGILFCFIEFGLIWAGVKKGNGKDMDLLSPQSLVKVQQIQYATDIFYIICLYVSRASVLLLFKRLQSANKNLLWHISLGILTAWAIACIFVVTLKCNLSHPWLQYGTQCTGLLGRWEAVEITGIIIEVFIFGLGSYLAYLVQMPVPAKFQMLGLFATRFMVIIFAGLRLAHLHSWFHSSNPTFTGIAAEIYGVSEVYASLVTATTPLLKSFIFKFRVLAARPTIVTLDPPYNTGANSEKIPSENGNDSSRNKPKALANGRKSGKKKVEINSLIGYEQWMPSASDSKRNGSNNCGDTDVTAKTDDDRSDRTLNRDEERNREEQDPTDAIKHVE